MFSTSLHHFSTLSAVLYTLIANFDETLKESSVRTFWNPVFKNLLAKTTTDYYYNCTCIYKRIKCLNIKYLPFKKLELICTDNADHMCEIVLINCVYNPGCFPLLYYF